MKRTGLQRFRNMMLDNICVKRQQDVLLFALLRLRFQTSHCTVCPLEAFSNLTTSQSFALDTTKTSHIVHYFLIPWLTLISQSNGKGSKTLVGTFGRYRRGVPPQSEETGHHFLNPSNVTSEFLLHLVVCTSSESGSAYFLKVNA